MEIVRNEPELMAKRPSMLKPCNDCKVKMIAKQAVRFSFQFLPRLETYVTSSHKLDRMKKDVNELEAKVVSYCESYFNVKVISHDTSLVSRAKIDIEADYEQSPLSINNRSGWLLQMHSDTCSFRASDWSCELFNFSGATGDSDARSYPMTRLSAVVLLNDLHINSGGNLVFIDPLHSKNTLRTNKHKHTYSSIKHGVTNNLSVINSTVDHTHFVRYVDVPHWEDGIMPPVSYTVVLPRARRLIAWNSSGDNIHAVTQILSEHEHRFTFFLFMTVKKLP